jgi:hypothetical protein
MIEKIIQGEEQKCMMYIFWRWGLAGYNAGLGFLEVVCIDMERRSQAYIIGRAVALAYELYHSYC